MYYGKVFYYTVGKENTLCSVHYSPAKRYIEENEWYEEDATHRVVGGFYMTYKTIKSPNYGKNVDITKDFSVIYNNGFTPKNVKKRIPKCFIFSTKEKIWWDKNEFIDIDNQVEVKKLQDKLFPDYKNIDDYDDYVHIHHDDIQN